MITVNLKIRFKSIDYLPLLFKGEQFLEAGYVYAPYIPMYSTEFIPRTNISSRYSNTEVNPNYYSTIQVNNLNLSN